MSFMDISSHIEKNEASSILSALHPQQTSQDLSRFAMEIPLPSGVIVSRSHSFSSNGYELSENF